MKFFYLIVFSLVFQARVFCQANYSENLWLGALVNGKVSKSSSLTGDIGYRTYENFIKEKRTFLARIVFEKALSEKHIVGIGYAFFDHFSKNSGINLEQRPFLQYRSRFQKNKFDFQLRIRNEFRFFTSRSEFNNRSRVQFQIRYNLFEGRLIPIFGVETFLSTGKKSLFENRFTAGLNLRINQKISALVFYTLQTQSSYKGIQNIVGIQTQINLSENNKSK